MICFYRRMAKPAHASCGRIRRSAECGAHLGNGPGGLKAARARPYLALLRQSKRRPPPFSEASYRLWIRHRRCLSFRRARRRAGRRHGECEQTRSAAGVAGRWGDHRGSALLDGRASVTIVPSLCFANGNRCALTWSAWVKPSGPPGQCHRSSAAANGANPSSSALTMACPYRRGWTASAARIGAARRRGGGSICGGRERRTDDALISTAPVLWNAGRRTAGAERPTRPANRQVSMRRRLHTAKSTKYKSQRSHARAG